MTCEPKYSKIKFVPRKWNWDYIKAHWKVNNKLWETNKAVVKLPKKIERESVKNRAENSNKNLIIDFDYKKSRGK